MTRGRPHFLSIFSVPSKMGCAVVVHCCLGKKVISAVDIIIVTHIIVASDEKHWHCDSHVSNISNSTRHLNWSLANVEGLPQR